MLFSEHSLLSIIQNTGKNRCMYTGNQNFIHFYQDSFDQQLQSVQDMQNSHPPSAIPAQHIPHQPIGQKKSSSSLHLKKNQQQLATNYDLTFKKQQQFQSVANPQNFNRVRQNLFMQSSQVTSKTSGMSVQNGPMQKMISILRNSSSIEEAYQKLRQVYTRNSSLLSQLSLAMAYHLDERTNLRLQILTSMLTIKNLRKKRNSAKLNIEVVASFLEKDRGQLDKKRLQLLKMLVLQIQKKLMIESLKYGRAYRLLSDLEQIAEIQLKKQTEISDIYEEQFNEEGTGQLKEQDNQFFLEKESKTLKYPIPPKSSPIKTSHAGDRTSYYQHSRLAVFNQIVSSVLNKAIYPVFKILFDLKSKNSQRDSSNPPERHNSPISQRQHTDYMGMHFSAQEQSEQQEEFHEADQEQNEQSPVDAIESYIETLKTHYLPQAKKKQDIMRNYFLRWKINFLRNIIQKMQEEEAPNQEVQEISNLTREQAQKYLEEQFVSNKSNEGDLKREKSQLKQYLRFNRAKEFFKIQHEMRATQQIKLIMQDFHDKTLLRKAFNGLFENRQSQIAEKYFEYASENQKVQEEKTAQIYHKTTCLAKAFFGLKNLTKYSNFVGKCQLFLKRQTIHRLRYETNRDEQNQIKLKKMLDRKKRQTIFKYFCILKSQAFPSNLYSKADNFKAKKDLELTQLCFSALSLAWKKKLALQKRVENLINRSSAKNFYLNLRQKHSQNQARQGVNAIAKFAVNIQKKITFLNMLTANYLNSLQQRRIDVKKAKLQIERAKRFAREGLVEWRRLTVCRNHYQVIQKKLRKIKEVEEKEKIWKIWQNRLLEKSRQKRKDKLTVNHKIWLNKYYEKLCAIEAEEMS